MYVGKAPRREITKRYLTWLIKYFNSLGGMAAEDLAKEIVKVYNEQEARKDVTRMTPETTSEAKGYFRSFWDRLKK